VHGAFVFHVGAPGANPAGIAAAVLAESETPRSISLAFTAVRFFSYALLLLATGGTVALALTLGSASQAVRRKLLWVLTGVSVGLALASLTGIVLQGAESAGIGIADAARWGVIESVLETRFGQSWLARAGLALALAAVALAYRRRPGSGWLLDTGLVLCVGLIVTPAVAGHASTEGALSFVSDVVHVQAASIWIGGLAFLLLALVWAGADRWRLAAAAVPPFSTVAVVSVGALLAAGIVNGYLQIRTWSGLWETAYGRLVLVKAGLLIPIIVLAAWNNRRAVPRLKAGIASVAERRRFLRNVSAELGIVVAVVAVTAVLVAEPPARTANAASGPYAQTAALGDLELNLVVDPAVAGPNAIHLYLLTSSGQPADVAEVDVAASLASAGVGPLRLEARRLAPGHYVVSGAPLTLPGDWQVRVDARRGEFESLAAELSVPIRKDS
jgi:copper transport protein